MKSLARWWENRGKTAAAAAPAPATTDEDPEAEDEVLLPPGTYTDDDQPDDSGASDSAPTDDAQQPDAPATDAPGASQETEPMSKPEASAGATTTPPAADTAAALALALAAAATAAGLDTPEKLNAAVADAKAFRAEAVTALDAACVRLFGAEKGPGFARSMAHLPAAEVKSLAKSYDEQADARFGITGEGGKEGATRITGTSPAVAVEDGGRPGAGARSSWDRLTDAERDMGAKMGHDATPERREAYAKNVLAARSGEGSDPK